ncbi:MAG: RNA recognition motif domain-containing protein [Candidatus Saccharimonadales bacterium]
MSQGLYVSSLAWATTNGSLQAFFEPIGELKSVLVIVEGKERRSKGYGFVEFMDEANNQKAIDELDGKMLDGRRITVTLAKPKE